MMAPINQSITGGWVSIGYTNSAFPFTTTMLDDLEIEDNDVPDDREESPATRRIGEGLPSFVKKHKFVRSDLTDNYMPADDRPWDDVSIKKANLITSVVKSTEGKAGELHRPMLDLDFNVALVESSTPGHNHLYIDKEMPKEDLTKLVNVLNEVGLLQDGVKNGYEERGSLSLRLPWIDKNSYEDNKFDYKEYESRQKIREKVAELEQAKKDLIAQLAQSS